MLLDAKTNFVSGINVGHKNVKGIEFAIQKGDLNRDGFYGALGYTYTFARVKFDKFTNGTTLNTALNNAVAQYNAYTKYCTVTAPTDPRCQVNTGTLTYLAGVTSRAPVANFAFTSTGAAACFTPAGAPGSGVRGGQHRQPVLEHAGAESVRSERRSIRCTTRTPAARAARARTRATSPPHVLDADRQLQEGEVQHHADRAVPRRRAVRPSAAGRRHQPRRRLRSPINPAAPATTTGTDPRYPGSQPGAPYDASTCTGSIAIPNPFVGHFDSYGQYTEPNKLGRKPVAVVRRLQADDDSHRLRQRDHDAAGAAATFLGASAASSAATTPADRTSPTSTTRETRSSRSCSSRTRPNLGNVFQSTTAGQGNPFQVYATINIKF